VVGVSWYESRAYGNWLSAQTGESYRLPTEAEWEAAARGTEARKYAWGDEFDPLRGNTLATRIRRTTPVGIFVEGETPEGLSDLTGNVNEWTGSLWGAGEDCEFRYPYCKEDGREDPHAGPDVRRVLRGGSWRGDAIYMFAAYRRANLPDYRYNSYVFRLVSCPSPPSA
jgi:formylglycine-generating enzyme required for sulfatase activity